MIDLIINYNFLQNALLGAVLASIACGVIGAIIIEKNLVMMSGGIAHASFGGVGMGYFLEIEPIIGALFFSILSSLGVGFIKRRTNTDSNTLIGMFWTVGMALGILFINFTPGYPPDMNSYLFGDILTISKFDLLVMLLLDLLIIFIIFSFLNYWRSYLFDEEFIEVLGINVKFMDYLLFVLIACTIVVLIKVVGIILVLALLTAPAAVAKLFTYNLNKMILGAVFLGIFFSITGLYFSYQFSLASGPCIILVAGMVYFIIVLIKRYNM